ncbi:MAG TPA: hypothetical protein VNA20_01185 [Frankiaceae bacterium]|nr:hypothetical protein [Frankiaceae bacterium]
MTVARTFARSVAAVGVAALVAGPLASGAQAAPRAPKKPPPPTIVAKPASPTNVRSATFEFTHPTAGVTFQCSLDGAAYATCLSPRVYEGPLGEATHVFKVRARDASGALSTAVQVDWTVDLTAPAAPALSGVPSPSPTSATSATLAFSSAGAASYACSLDNAAATPCTSPVALSAIGEGPHAFTVTARDAAGNVSAPAVGAWTVDTTPPPAPTITTGPADLTNATAATFQVFNPDAAATLACSLDGAAFAACPAPLTYAALSEGAHTFDVRAADSLGNTAAAPRFSWTVDLTAPAPPAILTGPDGQTASPTGSFTFNAFDAVELLCSVDDGAYATCPTAYTTAALADGPHTLHVKGKDAAGNESGATPYAWSIDNTPPPAATVTGPAALTNATSATFTISNSEQLVTFTCALDGGSAVPCESGVTYSGLPDGPHSLVVTSNDALGNGTPYTHSWTIDAAAPSATLTTPTALTSAAQVVFSEPASGITGSSLALRVSGSTTAVPATQTCYDASLVVVSCATGAVTTAAVKPTAALVAGERYTVVTNPTGASTIADAAGNALPPTTFAFRALTQLQETSPASSYRWRAVSTSAAYGGSYRSDRLGGATASYAFSGTSITWYTVKARNQGVADVYVDGVKKATVNNYATKTTYKVPRTVSGLAAGKHTLKIVVRGLRGSTSGTGTYVVIDAVKAGGGTLVATPSLSHTWRISRATAASGGAQAVADLAGADVTLRFRGTGVSWYTSTGRNRGIVRIYVDGVLKATVDNYAATTTYNVRRVISGLSDARHTVRLVVIGKHRAAATGNVATVDRWVVL